MASVVRVGVCCFVWRNGTFVMLQRAGSHGAATWSIPGGHMELNESWDEAARREVREETGLEIGPTRFVALTHDIFSPDKQYVTIWLEADWKGGEPRIMEPHKCTAQGWYTFQTLPQPLFEPAYKNLRTARPDLFATTAPV